MSKIGKLTRGFKWSLCKEEELKKIREDSVKNEELNFFEETCKGKDKKEIGNLLIKIRHMNRGKAKESEIRNAINQLEVAISKKEKKDKEEVIEEGNEYIEEKNKKKRK